MQIIYSEHAEIRMKQRGLTTLDIENILIFPICIKKSFKGRKIATGKIRNRIINAVFIEKENYIRIITIF